MLKSAIWKNDVINWYGFLAICKPLIEILSWNVVCEEFRNTSKTVFSFFWKFKKIVLSKNIKNPYIEFFGGQKYWKYEIAILKSSLFYTFGFFPFAFCFIPWFFLWFVLTFIVLCSKVSWHWVTKIGITQKGFDKIVQNLEW